MPSTMTDSNFTIPQDDARLPLPVPLPWDSGSASWPHRRSSWER
jgi:hypothetical protein